jgi:hypothetical protein
LHLLGTLDSDDEIDIPLIRNLDALYEEENKLKFVCGDALKCMLLTRLPRVLCIRVQRRFLDPCTHESARLFYRNVGHVNTLCVRQQPRRRVWKTSWGREPSNVSMSTHFIQAQERCRKSESANCGHSQCYRRDADLVSDEVVKAVEWTHLLSCEAYMLLYEAVV